MFRVAQKMLDNVLKSVGDFQTTVLFASIFLLFVDSLYNASGITRHEILHKFQHD